MVRRSSRLKNKTNELKGETSGVDGDEKYETEDLEYLVKRAYAVIKEKIEDDEEKRGLLETGEDIGEKARTEDFRSVSSRVETYKVSDCHTLASELDPGVDSTDLYFNINESSSRPVSSASLNSLLFNDKQIMKKCVITSDFEKKEKAPLSHVSYYSLKKQKKIAKDKSAGSSWFNMPAPEMTAELKRDLNIIRMRGVLDPKRHYKKNNSNKLPKFFQIGTVVNGPADFYSSRIPKSGRKRTIIDSLLSDAEFRRYNKRKYLEIQATKENGKKGFYRRSKKKRR